MPPVPFAEFWLLANDALFDQPPPMVEPAVRALQQRWSAILGLPADQQPSDQQQPSGQQQQRRIELRSDDIRAAVAQAFPAQPRPWPMAVHHSPDLMIAGPDAASGGRFSWVLGEIHPSIVTTRYATWMAFHDDPEAIRAGMRHDLGRDAVFLAETAVEGGVSSRLSNVLASDERPAAGLRGRLVAATTRAGCSWSATARWSTRPPGCGSGAGTARSSSACWRCSATC